MTVSALFCAIISALSLISIPLGAVPLTLQLFGIYAALYYNRGAEGFVGTVLYVCLGCIGVPVFSGLRGGVHCLFDTTGGFIFGFILLSGSYCLMYRLLGKTVFSRVASTAVSLAVFYLSGSLFYAAAYLGGVGAVLPSLVATVFPFIPFDILKIALAMLLSSRLYRHLTL